MSLRSILLLSVPVTLMAAAPFGYSLTALPQPKATAAKPQDQRKAAERLCASRSVNERLKARIFDDAGAVGSGPSSNLDLLASFSEVRMDQPLLKSRDEELGVTICSGRFVLLLPPGSEQRFGGRTLLQAEVEYSAQPAADGSGIVYQLKGADSIVYRLAAYNLKAEPDWPARKVQTAVMADLPPPVTVTVPSAMSLADLTTPEPINPPVLAAPAPAPAIAKAVVVAAPAKPAAPVKEAKVEQSKPVKLAVAAPPKIEKPHDKPSKAEPVKADKQKAVEFAKAEKADAKRELAAAEKAKSAKAARLAAVEKAHKAEQVKLASAGKAKAAKLAVAEKKAKAVRLAAADKAKAAKAAKFAAAQKAERTRLAAAEKAHKAEQARLAAAEQAKAEKVRLAAAEKAHAEKAAKLAAIKADQARAARLAMAKAERARLAKSVTLALRTETAEPAQRCGSGSAAERYVCANPGLAAKQRTANNVLNSAMEEADQRTRRELTGTRARFAAYLQRCHSETCVAQAFDDRIAEIRDIASN